MSSQTADDHVEAPPLPSPRSETSSNDEFDTPLELVTSTSPGSADAALVADSPETLELSTPTNETAIKAAKADDDNATLAALAADSSSSPLVGSGNSSTRVGHDLDSPSFLLVASLRSQITDLTSQVSSLNAKLVNSYTRIGDLEDDLHDGLEQQGRLKAKVTELDKDKLTWEREIEVGGWVEREHVQDEMQRLMHQVVEETKSRETAVQAHSMLETEIENLTSSLFTEANRMVAVERFARARAEDKMRSLEEAGVVMAGVLEALQGSLGETVEKLERTEAEVETLRARLGESGTNGEEGDEDGRDAEANGVLFSDGERVVAAPDPKSSSEVSLRPPLHPSHSTYRPHAAVSLSPRLSTSILPYNEFIAFITYLRQLRVTVLSRPPESTGYPHPYISSPSSMTITSRGFGTIATPNHSAGSSSGPSHPPSPIVSPAQLLAPHLPLSSHLSQPFLKRCVEEDSDPSLRLDLAPGLGFLSRRTISAAIVDGALVIEPIATGATLPSAHCALCGVMLEPWYAAHDVVVAPGKTSNASQTMRKVLGAGGWGATISGFGGAAARREADAHSASSSSSGPATPVRSQSTPVNQSPLDPPSSSSSQPLADSQPSPQIHIFRASETATARYALCPTYCLARLRAVCEFWTYVRAMERGLLLEEGFRFVSGRGDALGRQVVGRGKSSLEGLSSVERLGEKERTQHAEVEQVVGGEQAEKEMATKKEEVEEGEKGAGGEHAETKAIVAVDGELKGLAIEEPKAGANGEKTDEGEKAVAEQDDTPKETDASAAASQPPHSATLNLEIASPTSSPMASRTTSASTPTHSSAVNKPPIPKRSVARAITPVIPSSEFAAPANPAPSPRHPAAATSSARPSPVTAKSALGIKTNELGAPQADGMDIVGGATGWEDRCWTEVVRLKESVFWTRVGRTEEA